VTVRVEPPLDVVRLREQFPALKLRIEGQPAVFLDNPAGTQVPLRTIERTAAYWRTMNANHGGLFHTSRRSDAMIEEVRNAAAAFLNAPSPEEIIFGANMTTLTFAMSRAIGRELQEGDEILVSRLEHDANLAPWRALREKGVAIKEVEITVPECRLDMEDLRRKLTPKTRLVALTHASNVVGTIPALRQVAGLAHSTGAMVWVDAVHYAPHGMIDVQAIDCDFLVCSAYKFYGPHLGILYGKREHLQRLRPYKVRPAPEQLPGRWETGTQNHECLAGLLGTFEYLAEMGGGEAPERGTFERALARIHGHERGLVARLLEGLAHLTGVRVYGITDPQHLDQRAPTVSLSWSPHDPADLSRWLANHQVFTWHGDHYAPDLIDRLGLSQKGGTLRIGIAHYNTESEIDLVLELLEDYRRRR
jgi:cysteine desulfurase family protein (TIGR01976 family)